MHLDAALKQRQANSGPFGLSIQFVEQAKNPIVILRLDADAIIAHKENRFAVGVCAAHSNFDARLRLIAYKFGCVIYQVLDHFDQTRAVAAYNRQSLGNADLHAAFLQSPAYYFDCIPRDFRERNGLGRIHQPTDSRQLQQIVQQALHLVCCYSDSGEIVL
jgi:hypothetical protein